ncbi:MAG: toxin-antitoxin system HicB family antitoxin [Tepidisphaeraceae bacterium]
MSTQTAELLETVREVGAAAENWADFTNALFDQKHGILAKAFPSADDRRAFVESEEFRQIKTLLKKAKEQSGLIKGATPTKSGKLLVRLPVSMHEALDNEAEAEGVSLNQLVVAKLALQFSSIRESGRKEWVPTIVQAYTEVRGETSDGKPASEDRVIAEPELDARFLKRCRELGATESDLDLNKKLIYARKKGFTAHLPKVPRMSLPREARGPVPVRKRNGHPVCTEEGNGAGMERRIDRHNHVRSSPCGCFRFLRFSTRSWVRAIRISMGCPRAAEGRALHEECDAG